jgi:hypothetical protein
VYERNTIKDVTVRNASKDVSVSIASTDAFDRKASKDVSVKNASIDVAQAKHLQMRFSGRVAFKAIAVRMA